jgi:hypothetical protein
MAAYTKEQLILRVVLPAQAGKVFIGIGVEPANRLDIANRRSEGRPRNVAAPAVEESPGTVDADRVVKQRKCRYEKNKISDRRYQKCSSYKSTIKCGISPGPLFVRLLQLRVCFQFQICGEGENTRGFQRRGLKQSCAASPALPTLGIFHPMSGSFAWWNRSFIAAPINNRFSRRTSYPLAPRG